MPNYPSADELIGASDLEEKDVELESIGMTVRVRTLAGAYSNKAISEAYETTLANVRGRQEQTSRLNVQRLEELQVQYGLVAPKLATLEQVRAFSQRTGKAWQTVVKAIRDISGLNDEEIAKSDALFPAGGGGEEPAERGGVGNGSGDYRPDHVAPTGA
jgi:hypothetical protein